MGNKSDFSIGSLNARGINNIIKRKGIFDWAHQRKFDILMLQECYCSEDVESKWTDDWGGGTCIFSHGTKHSKGTMILFNKCLDIDILSTTVDISGRYIIIKCIIQGEPFTLVNLYAPNSMRDKQQFFKDLSKKLDNINLDINDHLIMAGDWNSIQESTLDKKGGNENSGNTVTGSMTELLGQLELVDIWRCRNPELKRFTFRQKTPLIFSRLDYFMISNNMQDNIVDANMTSSIWSDHSAVTLYVKHLPPMKKGNSHWKFNSSLITDPDYVQLLNEKIIQWKVEYNAIEDGRVVWELLKYEIRKYTMSYCSQKKLDKKKQESNNLTELENLEVNLETNPSEESLLRVEHLKGEIQALESERITGAILRSKVKWVEEGEKSTKFFFSLEKQNYVKKHIRKLKLNNNVVTTDQQKIKTEMEYFYSNLYKSSLNEENVDDDFFPSQCMPNLSAQDKQFCDLPITSDECFNTLNTFKKNKSPGNDGLTFEFYKQFWDLVSEPLVKSFTAAYQEGELSVSQRQAIISLIEKSGKDRELLNNWRPISLLNLDYKILTKSLSLRLQKSLPKLIHQNQSGFVKGRFIGDSIRNIQDIMAYTDKNKLNGLLLFIDFEKAFDTIEWSFLKKALEKFNFGQGFLRWIQILYNNISSCIMNNGSTCQYFSLERGVRQGDPLSPYLFILALEILAIKIRLDTNIVGFKFNRAVQKLSLYADDMTIAVSDLKSAKRIFKVLKLFAKWSGLKINLEKTEGMWLGAQKGSLEEPLGITWPKTPIKALGIYYSYDKQEAENANFEDKIEKLIRQLHWWKARKLSLSGKILIVKALGISKFSLVASMLHLPEKIIKSVNTIIYHFIWNGKTDKVKRKFLIQNFEKGGLNMIDFSNYVKAAKYMWIQRYLDGSFSNWKSCFEYFSEKQNLRLYLRGNFDVKELPKSLPKYYLDSIVSWHSLRKKSTFETDFIWYNKEIKINGKTLYNHRLFQMGIWSATDLFKNNKVIPFKVFIKRGASNNDFMVWRGLVHILTKFSKANKQVVINRGFVVINGLPKGIECVTMKEIRECFNLADFNTFKSTDFKAKNKFDLKYGLIPNSEWKLIFLCCRFLNVMNYIKDIQFKILHRFLPTNRLLYKMGKVVSPTCFFCALEEESLEHFLFDCNVIKNLWIEVFSKWNRDCALTNVILDRKLVTFGMYHNQKQTERIALNIIILVGKAYIWNCKQNECLPCLLLFVNFLNQTMNTCQQLGPVIEYITNFTKLTD